MIGGGVGSDERLPHFWEGVNPKESMDVKWERNQLEHRS